MLDRSLFIELGLEFIEKYKEGRGTLLPLEVVNIDGPACGLSSIGELAVRMDGVRVIKGSRLVDVIMFKL